LENGVHEIWGGTAGGGCMLGLAGGLGDIDIEVEVVIWGRRVQRR